MLSAGRQLHQIVSLALSELVVRTEHVHDLVLIELLHVVASGSEVLAGVELTGLLNEDLTDSSRHGQTRVGVDVNLANGRCGSLAELIFGDTHCIGELTAVLVDGVHFFLGHRRRTVEHDGECGELLFDSGEHVECEGGEERDDRSSGRGCTVQA